jgi:hypothetical protein
VQRAVVVYGRVGAGIKGVQPPSRVTREREALYCAESLPAVPAWLAGDFKMRVVCYPLFEDRSTEVVSSENIAVNGRDWRIMRTHVAHAHVHAHAQAHLRLMMNSVFIATLSKRNSLSILVIITYWLS